VSSYDQAPSRRDDWDSHWDDYAEAASLNPAQQLRRRVIRRLLALGNEPARVLDVGCGQGDLLAELKSAHPGAELCGLDVSLSGLDVAQGKVPTATFLRSDLVADNDVHMQIANWATHAICSEVLEHVDDPERLLARARTLLAPDCRLVVTVPGGPMSRFDRHIGHRQHFTPGGLAHLLTAAGYEVEKVTGVGFPLFNLYRLVVIMRGDGLVHDVARANQGASSTLARLAMRSFGLLFALGAPETRWGWQVVGVARVPTPRS
jgi:SAM-dependent methyltransferase